MNARKMAVWGLPILIISLVVVIPIWELDFQRNRQDGWTTYSEVSQLDVNVLAFDELGHTWIGTQDEGVSVFDGETRITYIEENSGVEDYTIGAIAFDGNGRAWIGTLGGGVSVFDGDSWITYTEENSGLENNRIRAIAFDENGRAWIGTGGGGVSVFDKGKWITYLEGDIISAIAFDQQGRTWIVGSGVSVFDGESWITYTESNSSLGRTHLATIAIDERGRAWIGTSGLGLYIIDGDTWTNYTEANSGLAFNFVGPIAFDKMGRAWIVGAGITIFDGQSWITYTEENSGLSGDYTINAIAFDVQERVWIGGSDGVNITSLNPPAPINDTIVNLLSPLLPTLLIGLWLGVTLDSFPGVLIGLATSSTLSGLAIFFEVRGEWPISWLASQGKLLGIGWMVGGIIWEIVDRTQGNPRRQKTTAGIRIILIGLTIVGILFSWLMVVVLA